MISKNNSKKVITILKDTYSNTKPDLDFSNIYELTIAVVLSAQTTDKQVNSVTPELFSKYPGFPELANAEQDQVEDIIRSTGFYHNKAKNIIELAKVMENSHRGQVPKEMNDLVKIPGIGRKSANVILSIGYNIPGLAVDTHVARIAERLNYTTEKSPEKIERDLCAIIPPEEWKLAHILFIRHGRDRCKARNPLCSGCPLKKFCIYAIEEN